MAYTIIVSNITDTSAVLEVTTTTAISGGANLDFKVREGGPSGTIVSSGTLSFPSGTEADDTVTTTITGLTQSTTYYVAEDNKIFSTTFTTKATGYDDPKTATQEQWEDLVDRIKAKSDVQITMTTTDPGEGSALAENHYVAVYGGDPIILDYSTSEINTGTYWIDGKTIYKKTINTGALPNTTSKTVAHGISGASGEYIESLVEVEGFAKSSATSETIPLPYPSSSNPVEITVSQTNITITTVSDMTSYTSSYVTLYYTYEDIPEPSPDEDSPS